ncbi:rCG55812 [Rattus norvegicus]|uniref:RCG55812 n=1 Tax=Rattus norvegicus TaxID=10116 RepID=A6JLW1_RAT|nr:rCG55812 [Rattus norvegicus]
MMSPYCHTKLKSPMFIHTYEGEQLLRTQPPESPCSVLKSRSPQFHFLNPLNHELISLIEGKEIIPKVLV